MLLLGSVRMGRCPVLFCARVCVCVCLISLCGISDDSHSVFCLSSLETVSWQFYNQRLTSNSKLVFQKHDSDDKRAQKGFRLVQERIEKVWTNKPYFERTWCAKKTVSGTMLERCGVRRHANLEQNCVCTVRLHGLAKHTAYRPCT